jgi:type IV pilus assembly protein PilM
MKTPALFRSSTLPIGVDMSSTGVMLAQLGGAHEEFRLVDTQRIESEKQLNPNETLHERIRRLTGAMRDELTLGKFKGRRCVVGLGEDLLRVQSIRQPRMPKDEAARAIQLEAPDRLGFAADEVVEIGWIPAGEVRQSDQLRDEVIVVGAETQAIEELIDSLLEMGLKPVAIEPSFVASARCFERAGRRAEDESIVRVLLNVGQAVTELIVLRGSAIVFYKSLQIGGRQLNHAVAECLGITEAEAHELRKSRMAAGHREQEGAIDDRTDRALFNSIRPILDTLAREVAMCLRYFAVSFTGSRPAYALAIGEEAAEPQLVEHLGQSIGIPLCLGCPLEGVKLGGELKRAGDISLAEWSSAVGLSLRLSDRSIHRTFIGGELGGGDERGEAPRGKQAA